MILESDRTYVECVEDDQLPICWGEEDEIPCISMEVVVPILKGSGLSTTEVNSSQFNICIVSITN